jgi:hypothetical protein
MEIINPRAALAVKAGGKEGEASDRQVRVGDDWRRFTGCILTKTRPKIPFKLRSIFRGE